VKVLACVVSLALAAPLATQATSCGRFPRPGFDDADQFRVEGRYANSQYGYAVSLPVGRVGHDAPPPASNHGFGIVLSWTPRASIYVAANYEVADDDTLAKQEASHRQFTRQDAHRVLSTKSMAAQLGALPAARLIARYECKGLRGLYITDEVVALSDDRSVVYTMALLTTVKRYRKDKAVFEEMVRSFVLPGELAP